MIQKIDYNSTEILNDERAFNEEGYADAKHEEAQNTIRKMNCIILDVLAKDIVDFFKNSKFFDTDDTILISFVLNETDENEVHITNEQEESFELSIDNEGFFENVSDALSAIVHNHHLKNLQKEQGFLFKVNKDSVYQDIQSTMNKIINMVEPRYLINKEKHMLQEQKTNSKQVKQKPHL